MKAFFAFFLALLVSFHTPVFAKEYSFQTTPKKGDTVKIWTTANTAKISYTLGGNWLTNTTISVWKEYHPGNNSLSGKVFDDTALFVPNGPTTLYFNITDLLPSTTYYLGINHFPFETEPYNPDPSTQVVTAKLVFKPESKVVRVSGQVDTTKNPNPEVYDALLEYSQNATFTDKLSDKPEGVLSAKSFTNPDGVTSGINHDGTYFFNLRNIDAVPYWYRESFYTKDGKAAGTPVLGKFSGATGIELSDPKNEQQDFEQRSYRLLAPLPGLSVLLDPELCREQQIEHPDTKQICDINGFLNYLFKLLIGAAAVVLVIRIIIEGFRYATTDVLSIKINSKEKLMQGIWGLLLALSAWLILNTINPTLVANDISIPSVMLSAEEEQYQSTIPQDTGTIPTGSVAQCTEGVEQISTKGGKLVVCKQISAKVKSMIDAAWAQGIHLSGGGFRTAAEQIELRRQHCGATNIYNKNAKCEPPTAYPGHSNHESGLAVDFMCDGITIKTNDNKCFLWLKSNAGSYGLINFYKEAWHWSVNGR